LSRAYHRIYFTAQTVLYRRQPPRRQDNNMFRSLFILHYYKVFPADESAPLLPHAFHAVAGCRPKVDKNDRDDYYSINNNDNNNNKLANRSLCIVSPWKNIHMYIYIYIYMYITSPTRRPTQLLLTVDTTKLFVYWPRRNIRAREISSFKPYFIILLVLGTAPLLSPMQVI